MWYQRLIWCFVGALVLQFSCFAHAAEDKVAGECDYYNRYGYFSLSFPEGLQLGAGGASISSGIAFIFSDTSRLDIDPVIELYDPKFAEPGESNFRPDDVNFIMEYAKEGCRVSDASPYKGKKITCPSSEHIILEPRSEELRVYIQIHYVFVTNEYDSLYTKIVDSLLLMGAKPDGEFYDSARRANDMYYYNALDAAAQQRVDNYEILDIVCGEYRLSKEYLKGKAK